MIDAGNPLTFLKFENFPPLITSVRQLSTQLSFPQKLRNIPKNDTDEVLRLADNKFNVKFEA